MKNAIYFIVGILILSLNAACGSNNHLQDRAPAQFGDPYFNQNSNGITLFIPVNAIQDERISLDAVYYKGMKSALTKDEQKTNLYVANFRTGMGDIVMSKDPKDEYGNKPPQLPEKSPVSLERNEALIVFTEEGKIKYYKLKGIVEKQ